MPHENAADGEPFTASELRAWADQHPVVRELLDALPGAEASRPARDGLFVDAEPAPGIEVNGTTRVSVLRIRSVVDGDARLVGQVQVTERRAGGGVLRALHTFVHDPDLVGAREERGLDVWWLLVLDAHYARGGACVPAGASVHVRA